MIAFLGLGYAGIIKPSGFPGLDLGNLRSAPVLLSLFGLVLTGGLMALKVRGALLIGILVTAIAGLPLGLTQYSGIASVSAIPHVSNTLFKFDPLSALRLQHIEIIFVFFFLMLFDTVGTLVGVAQQAGFMKEGKLPKAERALLADALGTIQGAALGTSTVTCYVESAAGVAEGARTGLANLVTAGLFLLAIFFSPIVQMVGAGCPVDPKTLLPAAAGPNTFTLYPAIAPVLVIIGVLIMRTATAIDWKDFTEALPAFLTILMMPFTGGRITEGIAFGFISYVIMKVVSGRAKELHWIVVVFAGLFLLRYIFLMG
jgi:AGZA family xanthine/uracil permease-like MFS transporter